jgi:DNA-binding NtrC family response regulator
MLLGFRYFRSCRRDNRWLTCERMEKDIRSGPRAIRVGVSSGDATLAAVLASVLGSDFAVLAAPTPEQLTEPGLGDRFDALILDFDSISPSTDLLFDIGPPVIVMANEESRAHALDLVEHGAYGYVRKPPVVRELRAILRGACESRRLKGELETARRQLETTVGLDQLTGSSAQMQTVYKLIRKVANLDASVLVTGESGTGKELIARAIHNVGNRAKRPFVAVSCGAIPETLIEAELFGHEKGAFTGTVGTREGYFEKAGDGTLFLDEIGELKPDTQVKLLRVLQQREFSRLGSSRPIPLRARIVLATHRDLGQMVAEGTFRQDLFYRVNVMNIAAPALRDHPQDLPLLAQHFLRLYSEMYRKPIESIEPDALGLMQSYSWPGNVRELENVMQHAIIMADGHAIEATDLPDAIQEQEISDFADDLPDGSFERLLRDYKIRLVTDAIQQCKGNKTLAAQSLSISRAYLHRLIRPVPALEEVGIPAPQCIKSTRPFAVAVA